MSTLKFNRWQSIDGVTRNAVLQVVSATNNTEQEITSTSFVDTPLSLSITPTSATSKIYVCFMVHVYSTRSSTSNYFALRLLRDSTEIYAPYGNNGTGNLHTGGIGVVGASSTTSFQMIPIVYLDSPSTTGEITYKVQGSVYVNTATPRLTINTESITGGQTSTLTLMEIAQ